MGQIGMSEIIFVVLVILVLFGAKRLPEIGSALGKAIQEFRKASKEVRDDVKDAIEDRNDDHKS